MRLKFKVDTLFSVAEVAIIMGVCEATVKSWIKSGKLQRAHTISNQGALAVSGNSMRCLLQDDPRLEDRGMICFVEIPDEIKTKYLLAAKDKCIRELGAAETAMRKEMTQLNEIMEELFK